MYVAQRGGTPRAPWAQQEMPVMLAAVSGWVAVWLGYSLVRVLERALLSRQSFAWDSSTSRHADSLFLRSRLKDVSSPSLLFPRQREQKTKFICIGTERAGVNQPGTAPDLLGGTTGTELSVCPRQRCWGAADAGLAVTPAQRFLFLSLGFRICWKVCLVGVMFYPSLG